MRIAKSQTALLTSAAAGWATGLCLISLFVFSVKEPDPAWGSYWQLKPLLLTPLVAGMGAVFAHYLFSKGVGTGFSKVFFLVLAVLTFLFSLWVGIVSGLNGTLWD